jgi:prefoldin subunit 5
MKVKAMKVESAPALRYVWQACRADEISAQISALKAQLAPVQYQYRQFNEVRDALETLTRNGWELPDGADSALRQMADELNDLLAGIRCDGRLPR